MTTIRQIKELLRPVLEQHDDLELVGQWLHLKPARHLARAVLIDRTGTADQFRAHWALTDLCFPQESFSYSWGEPIYRHDLWLWSDPSMPASFHNQLEDDALPRLRAIRSLDEFSSFANSGKVFSNHQLYDYPLRKAVLDAARGEFRSALESCELLTTTRNVWQTDLWEMEYNAVTKQLYPLLKADDRAGIAKLLHEWEVFTAEHFGITHIWEPTPFPFEEA